MSAASQFDHHADTYDADLKRALAASGEDKDYFARGRVEWLSRRLRQLRYQPHSAIDYGCGIGDTSALLRDSLRLESVFGLDVSVRSLELARLHYASAGCSFLGFEQFVPQGDVDLVYCNGVFHHIPPPERDAAVDFIYRSLRAGGLFALWENNPWNPGTRHVMSRCAFDKDAVTLTPLEAARLLQRRGFQLVDRSFLFFFPRLLSFCRFLEPSLAHLPLGAQYVLLCRKS